MEVCTAAASALDVEPKAPVSALSGDMDVKGAKLSTVATQPAAAAHTCNFSSQEAETGLLQVQGQSGYTVRSAWARAPEIKMKHRSGVYELRRGPQVLRF